MLVAAMRRWRCGGGGGGWLATPAAPERPPGCALSSSRCSQQNERASGERGTNGRLRMCTVANPVAVADHAGGLLTLHGAW